jgi:hypothetical protein
MRSRTGLLVYYVVCILVGIMLAKLIEEPSLRLRDRLSNIRLAPTHREATLDTSGSL